ncbi:unnamed protein product [Pleuronectes platessa]|uniref:Uncharacterized protein n=1 Tax=Pleuronectes platessa TaxID=8262 RepID=A0A9N7YLC3_PLEPL|nr:unnamed protein product [Pleuronectes platessa]
MFCPGRGASICLSLPVDSNLLPACPTQPNCPQLSKLDLLCSCVRCVCEHHSYCVVAFAALDSFGGQNGLGAAVVPQNLTVLRATEACVKLIALQQNGLSTCTCTVGSKLCSGAVQDTTARILTVTHSSFSVNRCQLFIAMTASATCKWCRADTVHPTWKCSLVIIGERSARSSAPSARGDGSMRYEHERHSVGPLPASDMRARICYRGAGPPNTACLPGRERGLTGGRRAAKSPPDPLHSHHHHHPQPSLPPLPCQRHT